MLYGIVFEDINCSADGGLYAEMVRNRNLEDSDKPDYWTTESSGAAVVAITLDSSNPASSKNPHSLRVQIANPGGRRAGVVNEGFWGMSLTKGDVYELSFLARAAKDFTAPLTASLESSSGTV
jgi:alpha-N-arabinofuranosidase